MKWSKRNNIRCKLIININRWNSNNKVTFEGEEEGNSYYVLVDGEYYEIKKDNRVTIARTSSKINTEGNVDTLNAIIKSGSGVEVSKIDGNIITLKAGSEASQAVITVSYGEFAKDCTVSVVKYPTGSETAVASVTFSTDYGSIDVILLKDGTNEITNKPNSPKLSDSEGNKMIPVKWNDDGTSTNADESNSENDWYNYRTGDGDHKSSKWANAQTANGSYFVYLKFCYDIFYSIFLHFSLFFSCYWF